jgi:pimeloyl-ACP methyl ester carboxylesterase
MSKRRTALVATGVAAGVAAGAAAGAVIWRGRHRGRAGEEHELPFDVPPQDLGPVTSFDGTQIAVRGAGKLSAPVVLFVHGFSLDMTTWSDQWPELAEDFRVVLMDQRSHGRSGMAAHGDLTLRAMGRDVAAVLEAVSPEAPALVVGHSMGAMAILALAEQRPELFGPKVAGVVLIGAASRDLLRGAMGSVTELLRPKLGSLATAARRVDRLRKAVLAGPADLSGVIARVTQFGPDAPSRLVDRVVALAQSTASDVWTDGLPELMEMDLRHAVPRVRVPALVMVGEHDRVTPPAAAVALAGDLPDGHLAVIEGAGHLPMLECPHEVNERLRAFARGVLVPAPAAAAPPPRTRSRKKPPEEAAS